MNQKMKQAMLFTEGPILKPLLQFAVPVLFALLLQGIVGAFCVRIPVSYLMSRQSDASLFRVGLAIPLSTVLQIVVCLLYFIRFERHSRRKREDKR